MTLNISRDGLRWTEEKAEIPKMYLACGVDDSLLEPNRSFHGWLQKYGVDVIYEEGPGAHEWNFWNRHIKKVIDWLPLVEDAGAGVNSGNVGI